MAPLFKRKPSASEEAAAVAAKAAAEAEALAAARYACGEDEREALRERHQVRLITEAEEGVGSDRLPDGVYGFAYAPGALTFPLFCRHTYQSYEVHKLRGGTLCLVGFLPTETASQIETAKDALPIRLLADPQDGARAPVTIPLDRVSRLKEHSTRDGKGLELHVHPAQ